MDSPRRIPQNEPPQNEPPRTAPLRTAPLRIPLIPFGHEDSLENGPDSDCVCGGRHEVSQMLVYAAMRRRAAASVGRKVWVYAVRLIPWLPFIIPGVMPFASLKILNTTQAISDFSGIKGWPVLFIVLNTVLGLTALQVISWPLENLKNYLLGQRVRDSDILKLRWDDIIDKLKKTKGDHLNIQREFAVLNYMSVAFMTQPSINLSV